jgi:hypothetical protein
MDEFLINANEELKRVDHLIYVSLKYTRTVDVIRSIIVRLIDSYNYIFEGMLQSLLKKKKIKEIPVAPQLRCSLLKEKFANDPVVLEYVNLYLLLRRLSRAKYSEKNEFRRHVTMTAHFEGQDDVPVDIDIISEYYRKTKEFLEYIRAMFG